MEPDIIYSQITNDLIQCKIVHTELDKINEKLEKPPISLNDFFVQYYNQYK